MLITLSKSNPKADNIANQAHKKLWFLERIHVVLQNLLVRLYARNENGVGIPNIKIPDQRRLRPSSHPRDKRLVGMAAPKLVERLADKEMVVLSVN